jgi:hypothetical protein
MGAGIVGRSFPAKQLPNKRMKPKIFLAFVDDWELSGNGSGDLEALQLRPMRELVSIYNRHRVRGSFNAEVMQQLAFRNVQERHTEFKALADAWDAELQETLRQGHDVQLHIHPQWRDASYDNGRWTLTSDWSILNYDADEAMQMLTEGKQYLESLLKPVDAGYKCVSFRSGSWCIAPSSFILHLLVRLGIVFDMSIVGGVRYNTRNIKLDYTGCDETFLPFCPDMTDARRVSEKREAIVCVPTNHFYASRRQVFRHHMKQAAAIVKNKMRPAASTAAVGERTVESYGHEWANVEHASKLTKIYDKGVLPYLKGKHLISDIAQLDYPLLCEMLESIRQRAAASGLDEVPIILENHTKDISDFSDIERFVADVAKAPDVECITLTEMASHLRSGRFTVRSGRR